MPTYSFGEDSPLKFEIPDKLAQRYNEATEQFFKAQTRFNQKFGRRWNPKNDPIEIKWSRKQMNAWNRFGEIMTKTLAEQGPYHVNDIMDDFLVKNTVSALSGAGDKWGRYVSAAAMVGAAYVLLRGL